jgi:hypothetical protein
MSITYSIDKTNNVILEVWDGEITRNMLSDYWNHYLSDPEVMAIRRTVVDLRKAKILFKALDMVDLIHTVVAPKLNGLHWRTAIVVKEIDQQVTSYIYQVFAGFYSRDQVFSTMESALQWIYDHNDKE